MRGLINILKADPTIREVYFAGPGQWSLIPDRRHSLTKSRDEVMAMEADLPVEDIKPDELDSMVEENRLLKAKIEELEVENAILVEGKDDDDKEKWASERGAYQERIKALENQLAKVTPKNKKFNATT